MASVFCCYQDNNPAMANERGTQLSDVVSGSINKLGTKTGDKWGNERMTVRGLNGGETLFMCAPISCSYTMSPEY